MEQLWHVVFAISLFMNVLGSIAFIGSLYQINKLNGQIVRLGGQNVKAITSVTYTVSELTKAIEREATLSRQERDQFIRLVIDVEKRITASVKDNKGPLVTVNDFNGDHANVAQGERVNQKSN